MERELGIYTLAPLVVHAERSRVQFTPTLDYIPGNALRGAIASHYLQVQGNDQGFQELFVAGNVSFPDLWPSTDDAPGQFLPATARLCKRHVWKHEESLTDSLLRVFLAEVTGNLEPLRDQAWDYCPDRDCREINKRDRAQGYVTPRRERVSARKRLLAGTSIDRATGTAESGMLFSHIALEEDQYFKGVVRYQGDSAEALQVRLEQLLCDGTCLRIGAARSRGLGRVEVKGWGNPWPRDDLGSRVDRFNDAIKALSQSYKLRVDGAKYFTLTLESHLLLRDRLGQPITRLAGRSDASELFRLPGTELRWHIALPAVVRGWNAQQGLPREDEPAIGRGSVLIFCIKPGCETPVHEQLAIVEKTGLGGRRAEGFGRVRVCDPIHHDVVLREMAEVAS